MINLDKLKTTNKYVCVILFSKFSSFVFNQLNDNYLPAFLVLCVYVLLALSGPNIPYGGRGGVIMDAQHRMPQRNKGLRNNYREGGSKILQNGRKMNSNPPFK